MRAAATINSLVIGLDFCGMVLLPPRPSSADSPTSPTSVCAMRMTSCAIFASEPLTKLSQPPNSTKLSRCACHGIAGAPSFNSLARACMTAKPLSPSAAKVPAAPPNCTTSNRGSISANRSAWRKSGANQPAAFKPKVIGKACWLWVRPARTVDRCFSASAARWPAISPILLRHI